MPTATKKDQDRFLKIKETVETRAAKQIGEIPKSIDALKRGVINELIEKKIQEH